MSATSDAPAGDGSITRRDFNRRAVRSAAGVLLAASAEPALPAEKDDLRHPNVPDEAAELEAAVTLARMAAPHLPAGDLAELRQQVEGVLATARRLRDHHVPDGQEPDLVFHALLPEPPPR